MALRKRWQYWISWYMPLDAGVDFTMIFMRLWVMCTLYSRPLFSLLSPFPKQHQLHLSLSALCYPPNWIEGQSLSLSFSFSFWLMSWDIHFRLYTWNLTNSLLIGTGFIGTIFIRYQTTFYLLDKVKMIIIMVGHPPYGVGEPYPSLCLSLYVTSFKF